jgi:hypothetical protein
MVGGVKIGMFVVDVGYPVEISSLTIPGLELYASKLGTVLTRITSRKYPEYPANYEKVQVWDLGADNDYNILFDLDMLVAPDMYNVLGMVPNGDYVGCWQSFLERNLYNNRGVDVIVVSNFLVVPKRCHGLFKPLSADEHPEIWLKDMFYTDEFCMSLNRQMNGYKLAGLELRGAYGKLFKHLNVTTDKKSVAEAVLEATQFLEAAQARVSTNKGVFVSSASL